MVSSIGVIIATHGSFSEILVETTELILGRESGLAPFTFSEGETPRESSRNLQTLIRKTDRGQGVIILVDLFGGTPGSLALSLLEEEAVEVVTGVNLPMAITAATLDPALDLASAAQQLVEGGRQGIRGAGLMLDS